MTNKKKRIYISGKISGLSLDAAAAKFAGDQEMLEELGYRTYNPMMYVKKHWTWTMYMIKDLFVMLSCDGMYQNNDWKESRGAVLEHKFAKRFVKLFKRKYLFLHESDVVVEKYRSLIKTTVNLHEVIFPIPCKKKRLMYLNVGDRFKFSTSDTDTFVVCEKNGELSGVVTCVDENTLETRELLTSWYVFVVD